LARKRTVFQVAKEFNLSTEAVISYLNKLDYNVRTLMSPVTDEMYDQLVKKYQKEPAVVDADYEFRRRLKEKKAEEEAKREKARRELEERLRVAAEGAVERIRERATQKKRAAEAPPAPPVVAQDVEVAEPPAEAVPTAEVPEAEPPTVEETSTVEAPETAETPPKAPPSKRPSRTTAEERREAIVELLKADERRREVEHPAPKAPAEEKEEPAAESAEAKDGGAAAPAPVTEPEKKKRRKKKKDEPAAAPAPAATPPQPTAKKRRKKKKRRQISEEEIQESIRQTLAAMEDTGRPKRRRRRLREEGVAEAEESENVIRVTEFISAAELADLMGVEPTEVIRKCMQLGMMVSINQRLDMETIVAVADEFGYDVEVEEEYGLDLLEQMEEEEEEDESKLVPRPPVVTIMGHVDHGKTSLLDYIRSSNIVAGEAGGITQHIGAYEVEVDGRQITFLDTPGHEAFTAMRARGAQVTDIVVLVVAADDGVQPQTIEAISHAKAAGVPIVVAINKVDKPGANPERIRQQLAEHGVLVEEWGGKVQSVEISAKTGMNVDKLLEAILLEADVLELKANPERKARGVVIEARLDKGKGPVATVLVQSGTLHVGDPFVAGSFAGKVRAMYDERGRPVKECGPSTPVQVLGFEGVPDVGEIFGVMPDEKAAREIATKRQQIRREQDFRRVRHLTLDQISKRIKEGAVKELKVIIKADVGGSVEALTDALMQLATDEVSVNVIFKGVGGISESDVLLASASEAIIIGFNVRPSLEARETAARENVDIRLYKVIYDAVNEVKAALEGLLEPEVAEELTGSAEVRQTFRVPKVGVVAGCYVQSGKIGRNDIAKLYREDRLVYEGKIASLRRFKEDVREVVAGFECGIGLDGFDDIKVGDIIETYKIVETKRTLE
jgi:translation initiation factor IF-2